MTWLAWRLHRTQILMTLGVIVAAAAVLVYQHLSAESFLTAAGCSIGDESRPCSAPVLDDFRDKFGGYEEMMTQLLTFLPAVLGLFCGAPLFSREFERGTQVFALTQSVGRVRWWGTKLCVVGLRWCCRCPAWEYLRCERCSRCGSFGMTACCPPRTTTPRVSPWR